MNFAHLSKIIDGKSVTEENVIVLFIAANYEIDDQSDNPDQALIRFEFIELLVRIAIEKYKKRGMFNTAFQSFEHLILTNIIPASNYKEWHPFRETNLYTVDVNDVLETNLDLI